MKRWMRRLVYLLQYKRHEREVAEEMETHRAMMQERFERDGLPAADAAHASRRAVGNLTLAREDARAVWVPPAIDSVRRDVTYALRTLVRQPGFAFLSIAALA